MSADAALAEATDVYTTRWPDLPDTTADYEIFWINRAGVVVKDARSVSFAMEPVTALEDAPSGKKMSDDVDFADFGAAGNRHCLSSDAHVDN